MFTGQCPNETSVVSGSNLPSDTPVLTKSLGQNEYDTFGTVGYLWIISELMLWV